MSRPGRKPPSEFSSIVEIENRRPHKFSLQIQRPRITAVEIENFKAIGHCMRLDLKPLTLLFGNNSAGKSTIIHAFCYAHEILSHDDVDPQRISLGGHTVDLGGFENFVHAHDLGRTIRLRFDLDLRGWDGPSRQLLRQYRKFPDFADVESGWVTLETSYDEELRHPKLNAYEVGANGELIGRLETVVRSGVEPASTNVELLANLSHPLLDQGDATVATSVSSGALQVRETSDGAYDGQPVRVALHYRWSPMPSWAWDEPLFFQTADESRSWSRIASDEVQARLCGILVGAGKWLRDELNAMTHVGPVRDVQGTEVWNTLLEWEKRPYWLQGDDSLVEEVSDWLSRKDRLDTGYALRKRSVVELQGEPELVPLMRQYDDLRTEFESADGTVDIDGLARALAEWVIENRDQFEAGVPDTAEEVEARIKAGDEKIGVGYNRRRYPEWAALVAKIEKRRFTAKEINELAAAASGGRTRQEVELLDTRKGVPVRVQDVGVGISHILPVVVAALVPDRPGITAIEQPELHLHPRVQVELGDLFAQGLGQGGMFLIETHSEHLLQRIMRRMRQTFDGNLQEGAPALRPEDVTVFFVEPDGGETLIREMPLNERGDLVEAWPGGFFEEDLREMFDLPRTS